MFGKFCSDFERYACHIVVSCISDEWIVIIRYAVVMEFWINSWMVGILALACNCLMAVSYCGLLRMKRMSLF